MSENGEIYTAGKNFTLPPAVTSLTNFTSGHRVGLGLKCYLDKCHLNPKHPCQGLLIKEHFLSHATDFYLLVSLKIHLIIILGNRRIAEKQISI